MNRFPIPVYGPDSGSGSGGGGSSPSGSSPASPSPSPGSSPSSSPSPVSPSVTPSGNSGGDDGSIASEASASEQLDFSSIFGDTEEGGEDGSPSPASAQPKAPKAKEAAKPPSEPKASEVEPAAEPAAPAQTQTTSSPAVGTLDAYDPGALASALQANEAVAIQHVADTLFKLSAEEIEALENDTVGAIPRLLAKGMVKGQLNMLQQLSRLIPAMINRHGEVTKRHSANESKFYSRWPDLKPDVHGRDVLKYASVYRQMHPDATLETMIEDVGPMVMMAAKVQPSGVASAGNGVQAPSARGAPRGPQASPFVPAGSVAGGASPQQVQGMSDIEAMFLTDN